MKEAIILDLIKKARTYFLESQSNTNSEKKNIMVFEHEIEGELYRVFGIEKSAQSKEVIQSARGDILTRMNLSADTSIIQVIGDSANFQDDKVNIAKTYLFDFLNKHPKSAILYGLTGHVNQSAKLYDANGLVSAWLDENESERCHRILGNAVDFHTATAISEWKCNVGNLKNIFLVYTSGEPQAKFGDDVISSDYLVKKSNVTNDQDDFAICLEGGIQSFNQIVRMLNEDVKIFALKGIRGEKNPACFDKKTNQFISYFSAAEFLSIIKEAVLKNPNLNKYDINKILENYIYNPEKDGEYDPVSEKRVYANPSRADYSTKAALMESSLKDFITNETWKKLNLLVIVDHKDIKQIANDAKSETSIETNSFGLNKFFFSNENKKPATQANPKINEPILKIV